MEGTFEHGVELIWQWIEWFHSSTETHILRNIWTWFIRWTIHRDLRWIRHDSERQHVRMNVWHVLWSIYLWDIDQCPKRIWRRRANMAPNQAIRYHSNCSDGTKQGTNPWVSAGLQCYSTLICHNQTTCLYVLLLITIAITQDWVHENTQNLHETAVESMDSRESQVPVVVWSGPQSRKARLWSRKVSEISGGFSPSRGYPFITDDGLC